MCKFAHIVSQQGLANAITTISIFAITAANWYQDAGTENTDATCLRLFPLLGAVHIFMARFLSPSEQILIRLTLREVTGRMASEVIFKERVQTRLHGQDAKGPSEMPEASEVCSQVSNTCHTGLGGKWLSSLGDILATV
jgi:hypothetical protein